MPYHLFRKGILSIKAFHYLQGAQEVWLHGDYETQAVYRLSAREPGMVSGLDLFLQFLQHYQITPAEVSYLAALGYRYPGYYFQESFLNYLQRMRFQGDMYAILGGTVVFPGTPFVVMRGSQLQLLILGVALLHYFAALAGLQWKAQIADMRIPQVRRYYDQQGQPMGDQLLYTDQPATAPVRAAHWDDLLQPVVQQGRPVDHMPTAEANQAYRLQQQELFANKDLSTYPVFTI